MCLVREGRIMRPTPIFLLGRDIPGNHALAAVLAAHPAIAVQPEEGLLSGDGVHPSDLSSCQGVRSAPCTNSANAFQMAMDSHARRQGARAWFVPSPLRLDDALAIATDLRCARFLTLRWDTRYLADLIMRMPGHVRRSRWSRLDLLFRVSLANIHQRKSIDRMNRAFNGRIHCLDINRQAFSSALADVLAELGLGSGECQENFDEWAVPPGFEMQEPTKLSQSEMVMLVVLEVTLGCVPFSFLDTVRHLLRGSLSRAAGAIRNRGSEYGVPRGSSTGRNPAANGTRAL